MTSVKDRAPVGTDSSVTEELYTEAGRVAPCHPSASSFRAQQLCDKSPDAFTRNPKTPRGITQDPKKLKSLFYGRSLIQHVENSVSR